MVQKTKTKKDKKNEDVIVEISSQGQKEAEEIQIEETSEEVKPVEKKSKSSKKKSEKTVSIKKYEQLVKELEQQKISTEEMRDKYYRLAAEFDNYKKRMSKEFEIINKYAGEKVLKEIVTVFDDIVRAVENESEDQASESTGMTMIHKKFQKVLSDLEVKPIVSLGQDFDPDLHHALMVREDEGVDPDKVVEEFEKGYIFKDRVIKHSKVVVSK